jgi:hypothetical protein
MPCFFMAHESLEFGRRISNQDRIILSVPAFARLYFSAVDKRMVSDYLVVQFQSSTQVSLGCLFAFTQRITLGIPIQPMLNNCHRLTVHVEQVSRNPNPFILDCCFGGWKVDCDYREVPNKKMSVLKGMSHKGQIMLFYENTCQQ